MWNQRKLQAWWVSGLEHRLHLSLLLFPKSLYIHTTFAEIIKCALWQSDWINYLHEMIIKQHSWLCITCIPSKYNLDLMLTWAKIDFPWIHLSMYCNFTTDKSNYLLWVTVFYLSGHVPYNIPLDVRALIYLLNLCESKLFRIMSRNKPPAKHQVLCQHTVCA